MRVPVVAGNWKMNGSRSTAAELLADIQTGLPAKDKKVEVIVCPPFILVGQVAKALEGSSTAVGGQNIDVHEAGAYTGETAAGMLLDHGCRYAIVGHSERRTEYGDTDELVAEKAAVASGAGLAPIVCVGETLEEREGGITAQVVGRQVAAVLDRAGTAIFPQAVIAYEPVWAIGTGRTASVAQAQEVHALIRQQLYAAEPAVASATRILYGGSVKPDNASALFASTDIDGGLIGGASLVAADFLAICEAAAG